MFNSMNGSKEFVNPVDYHKSQEDEYAVRNKFEKSATHINLNGSKPNLSSLPRYLDLGLWTFIMSCMLLTNVSVVKKHEML